MFLFLKNIPYFFNLIFLRPKKRGGGGGGFEIFQKFEFFSKPSKSFCKLISLNYVLYFTFEISVTSLKLFQQIILIIWFECLELCGILFGRKKNRKLWDTYQKSKWSFKQIFQGSKIRLNICTITCFVVLIQDNVEYAFVKVWNYFSMDSSVVSLIV